jgi:hypothetical protein
MSSVNQHEMQSKGLRKLLIHFLVLLAIKFTIGLRDCVERISVEHVSLLTAGMLIARINKARVDAFTFNFLEVQERDSCQSRYNQTKRQRFHEAFAQHSFLVC